MSSYRRFRTFLQEQHCEEAFDRAFYHHNGFISLDESLWQAGEADYILAQAFDWRKTPEGRAFWVEIDRKWHAWRKSSIL